MREQAARGTWPALSTRRATTIGRRRDLLRRGFGVMEEQMCVPIGNSAKPDPNSWCQLDCLCCPKPAAGTALGRATAPQEEAGIGLFRGRAIATDSADAAAEAAADALCKLEVDRAMASYGSFDSSSGLVVATAGRSAPALAALLASAGRGTLRKIIVANCCAGGKMAQALSFGIQEQLEQAASSKSESAAPQHVMSHAGGSTEEHAAWTAAVRRHHAGSSSDSGLGGRETGADVTAEDGQDWAALQAHLQADGIEAAAGGGDFAASEALQPAEVCVEDAQEVPAPPHHNLIVLALQMWSLTRVEPRVGPSDLAPQGS